MTDDGCHLHARLSLRFQQPHTSLKNFSPKMRNATTSKVRRQRFTENLKRFRLCSQLPEVFVKTKEVHAKFEAEEDFRLVTRKQGKKFFSKRTWWGVWKTGRDLRCLPALSFSVSLISWQKGERRLWNSLLQRNNHSFPVSLPYSVSVSLYLSVAHTDQTLLSMTLFCIAMNTNQQD